MSISLSNFASTAQHASNVVSSAWSNNSSNTFLRNSNLVVGKSNTNYNFEVAGTTSLGDTTFTSDIYVKNKLNFRGIRILPNSNPDQLSDLTQTLPQPPGYSNTAGEVIITLSNNKNFTLSNSTSTLLSVTSAGMTTASNLTATKTIQTSNLTASNLTVSNITTTGVTGRSNLVLHANPTLSNATFQGTTTTGHILPAANITYDLGSPSAQFRSLYISSNTIFMGNTKLRADPTTGIRVTDNSDNDIPLRASKLIIGNVELKLNAQNKLATTDTNTSQETEVVSTTATTGTGSNVLNTNPVFAGTATFSNLTASTAMISQSNLTASNITACNITANTLTATAIVVNTVNVSTYSNITTCNLTASNVTSKTASFSNIDFTGALTSNGQPFTGGSDNAKIIQHLAYLAPSNITPSGTLNLSKGTTNVNIGTWFTTPTNIKEYGLFANPYSNASVSQGGLTVIADYRNTTYNVLIYSSNLFGNSTNATMTITESIAPVPTTSTLGTVTLNANTQTYTLSSYFGDTTGSSLSYALTANPNSNASIAAGVLSVTGLFRGSTYNVIVRATNGYNRSSTNTLAVTENTGLPTTTSLGSITLNKNTQTYTLSSYFTDTTGTGLTYAVTTNPYTNATISAGVLSVVGNYRNTNYNVIVTATTNSYSKSATNTLAVTENVAPNPTATSFGSTSITTNTATFTLSSYFSDSTGSGLTYSVTANPYSNATISSGVLSIVGNNRNVQYTVTVTATNGYGKTATSSVTVTDGTIYPINTLSLIGNNNNSTYNYSLPRWSVTSGSYVTVGTMTNDVLGSYPDNLITFVQAGTYSISVTINVATSQNATMYFPYSANNLNWTGYQSASVSGNSYTATFTVNTQTATQYHIEISPMNSTTGGSMTITRLS